MSLAGAGLDVDGCRHVDVAVAVNNLVVLDTDHEIHLGDVRCHVDGLRIGQVTLAVITQVNGDVGVGVVQAAQLGNDGIGTCRLAHRGGGEDEVHGGYIVVMERYPCLVALISAARCHKGHLLVQCRVVIVD